ncbi:hypothetical protein SeMB42_g01361 [Synchytrium endobioticum]|uniref:Uncharacterized protein n=1 Tax=Synchytrium endobioticum TaxID=286115 RepID=A0A507DLM1_9FUNG|nr:hypothetical protein SeMB42_g01361 [Synchytrium endobioticum]
MEVFVTSTPTPQKEHNAQSAPTRRKDAISKAVRKLVNAKGDTTRRGMTTLAGISATLVTLDNPDVFLLRRIAVIATEIVPTAVEYTIDELLWTWTRFGLRGPTLHVFSKD